MTKRKLDQEENRYMGIGYIIEERPRPLTPRQRFFITYTYRAWQPEE